MIQFKNGGENIKRVLVQYFCYAHGSLLSKEGLSSIFSSGVSVVRCQHQISLSESFKVNNFSMVGVCTGGKDHITSQPKSNLGLQLTLLQPILEKNNSGFHKNNLSPFKELHPQKDLSTSHHAQLPDVPAITTLPHYNGQIDCTQTLGDTVKAYLSHNKERRS